MSTAPSSAALHPALAAILHAVNVLQHSRNFEPKAQNRHRVHTNLNSVYEYPGDKMKV